MPDVNWNLYDELMMRLYDSRNSLEFDTWNKFTDSIRQLDGGYWGSDEGDAFYGRGVAQLIADKLGIEPPTMDPDSAPIGADDVALLMRKHAEHARTWNVILRSARKPAVSGAPGHSLVSSIASAPTIGVAAAAALRIEDEAAQAHSAAAGSLTLAAGVAAAASIAPVEAMHAAILRFIMGEYPTPVSFTVFPAAAG